MTVDNLELQESGWEELRKDRRRSLCYSEPGSPSVGSRSWKSMEMEIQSLLEKLQDTNDSMSRCAASATPTTFVTQKLARHRDIFHEFIQVQLS
ncbi:hypothetical protein GIB67_004041 [Kingdonia uniflora]|uniref:Uncharacterized protein n=1 Tax=Kingdonia uniflora TaxID=39325 RepID=A0A7J7NR54_9MAGN|nr:hypothetical protein GIB67_004041 [Kingdonia uniflora]